MTPVDGEAVAIADSGTAQGADRIYRHSRIIRVTHWLNAVAIIMLLVTGFAMTQLHAPLYWGDAGQDWGDVGTEVNGAGRDIYPTLARAPEIPWQDLRSEASPDVPHDGLRAWFDDRLWAAENYLRTAIRVGDHILFAWIFLFNGIVYLVAGIATGRFRGILRPAWSDLSPRRIGHELWNHLRLRFPEGDAARSYNLIQKYSYLLIIFVVLPLQLATGLALFPWMDAAAPWLKDIFFGRQSARTIHFACAALILAFLIVHLAMVVLSGFRNNMRSMITGWYRLPR